MAIADLTTALQNIDTAILNLTANPKPSYSINGQSVQWGEYFKQLTSARQDIANQLVLAQGPGEDVWEGVT